MVNRLSSSVVQLRRCYWTATTFRSSSPHKLVEAIQQNIQAFQPNPSTTILDPPSVLLFTISKRIPSELLESLVRSFQNLVPAIEPIGCLTQDSSIHLYSASIAKWSGPSADLVPFTSTIPSRPSISVGREILPSDQGADSRGDYTGHAHHVGAESTVANQLPEELRRIPAPSPQPFLKLLQRTFPSAILMGLLGSSTAFETGRTSTLFRGRSILGDHGAVGIAVLKPSTTSTASPIVRYTNMRTLGNPMRVTRSQGNIILTLDSKKATSYLLEVIMKSDDINESARSSELIISKEKEFFLGFLNEQHLVVEICRIIGGSTSRGTMALDREKEIKVNQLVQAAQELKALKSKLQNPRPQCHPDPQRRSS
ncbi:hypothetical protein VP01_1808g5 [Puccinia sorghi]|uniref:FIST domain-containing protein n=1 Tax=Puccinia sorghi TaxID=27349 RepID=A0A0L6VE70_9BASI|nr:hypothetical protein VP01_1808g5 [Puccinia sorghi]